MTKALDTQIGGEHYKKLKIQPMEYSMANGLDACQHTAIKYITRFRDKGGITDLQKAKHCIDMLIDFERTRLADLAIDFVVDEIPTDHEEVLETFRNQIADLKAPMQKTDPFGQRDADGWYTWNGDDTMRPAGIVEVTMRDGWTGPGVAEAIRWEHRGDDSDVTKWRQA